MTTGIIILLALLPLAIYLILRKIRRSQLAYIRTYEFHPAIGTKVQEKYPHLTNEQVNTVFRALRDYFTFCNQARKRSVSMPSQVVDVAWHEFILFTRAYELFSKKALGRFLHHTPTVAMKSPTTAQEGIKRAWRLACAHEGINPSTPTRLPLLFAIDSKLNIEDGFFYSTNCKDESSSTKADRYCASHIGCASGCGGDTSGSSDSGGFFDGFGDGGGDGGGGGGCGSS